MPYWWLAAALIAGACGTVSDKPADAGVDAAPGAVMWHNQPADVPFAMYGGGGKFCMYKITLKQLDVQLAILPSGQVTSGHVQDLNFEEVVPSTTPFICMANDPMPIAPNIAMYQLATAAAGTGGPTLTFQGAASNLPPATLVITLTKLASLYSATLTFQRSDGLDPLVEWKVMTTVPLSPQ